MKQNGEIIKNACTLSTKPDVLLDFISDQIVSQILQNDERASESHVSKLTLLIPKELPEGATFDLFHNKYIFYVTSADDTYA